jgi:hypothetical protein
VRVPAIRLIVASLCAAGLAAIAAGCGSTPTKPTSPPPPPVTPPANNLPVVDSITVQGSRLHEPANFADASESVAVAAKVHDDETAADQLQYAWTATAGTFTGTGPNVTWVAPSSVSSPADVTITLKVTEKYGTNQAFEHSVEATAKLSLHDSVKEVGDMSRQFLLDFSDTTIKDADRIMRNFGGTGTCPNPSAPKDERDEVITHYTFFRMLNYRVDQASVTTNFGSTCPTVHGHKPVDACAYVGVMWDSIDTRDNSRVPNAGTDQITASYSPRDARWFLCSSDYDGHLVSNPAIAVRYPR